MQPETEAHRRVGVEHEYQVRRHGTLVDFRTLIHRLPIDGRRIDPGDREAYFTTAGFKITCDGPEAELATPPVRLGQGFVGEILDWTAAGGEALTELLGDHHQLIGVSTHISVEVDDRLANRVADLFARTFAPAVMLLMDAENSPGLLVRPRHGRLELGGEFVTGEQLAAALALAVGGVIVCESAAGSSWKKSRLPPPVAVDVVAAVDRYGWFVARDAFGTDLYAGGRDTLLQRERSGTISAQRHLRAAWRSARRALRRSVSDDDRRAAELVTGRQSPIPLETGLDPAPPRKPAGVRGSPFGRAMRPIVTPSATLVPTLATWDYVVFAALEHRDVFISVPTEQLVTFLSDASTGVHDVEITARSAGSPTRRRLVTYDEARRLGFWDSLAIGPGMAAPERGPDGVVNR